MKKIFFICFMALASAGLSAQVNTTAPQLKNNLDSASYALGVLIGSNMKMQIPPEMNLDLLLKALGSSCKGEALPFEAEAANEIFGAYSEAAKSAEGAKNKAIGTTFLEENKKKPGVMVTASGLQYEVMKRGTSEVMPKATDKVKVHYHGTLIDGSIFDSSVDRGEPISFGLNQVIPGWTEGVQLMHVGDKFKLFIPSDLAYGENSPSPTVPSNSVLIFEVELLDIEQ